MDDPNMHAYGEHYKLPEQLSMATVDEIANDGCRNAAGGIYATRVQEFAREVQRAFAQQNGLDVPGLTICRSEARPPKTRDDGMPASANERRLRRLLAIRTGIPHLYTDDGEASGTEHGISIDFMRDPVADIDAKLLALNLARFKAAEGEPPNAELTGAPLGKKARDALGA